MILMHRIADADTLDLRRYLIIIDEISMVSREMFAKPAFLP